MKSAFDVPLNDDQKTALAIWLSNELENAQAAKASNDAEVDYWWSQYEQARTRSKSNLPWPDAADLTSYIPCEKVDSIHARIMDTVWQNPIWTVEGFGQAADRAPMVEELHQYWAEEERLQRVLDKLILNALVEPRGLLEISESSEKRLGRKTIVAKPQQTEDGGVLYDEEGNPSLQQDDEGKFLEATPEEFGVEVVVDSSDVVRTGPQYRIIPYRDSVILPGHARDDQEIWGYAKRFWLRRTDLVARAKDGVYDEDAVDKLNATDDREQTTSLSRSGQSVAPADNAVAEKELWEGLVLIDLNAVLEDRNRQKVSGKAFKGARWYLVTLHLRTNTILRWKHDDFERSRYVSVILFPRPDRATEGFSFVGHKLITTTEEHTAYRNMAADRSALAVSAPIMKVQGELWDADEQPWGPKAIIDVRDPRAVSQVQVADVPVSVYQNIDRCERTSERLAGVNDIASGATSEGPSTTLGEQEMRFQASAVRIKLIVKRFQEAMEDIGQIRHAIRKRVLSEQRQGVDAPDSVLIGIEGRGVPIDQYLPDGKVTAALLEGSFRFKPYGSVETANIATMRSDMIGALQALMPLMQAFPLLAPMFQTPQAARAMGRAYLRAFRVPNPQAFLGSPSADMAQQQAINMVPMPAMVPPGMGMMPPGMGMPPGMPGMEQMGPPGPPMPPGPTGVQ